MKFINSTRELVIFGFALVCLSAAFPGAAQTNETQSGISPQISQSLEKTHGGSGHRYQTPHQKESTEAWMVRLGEVEHAGEEALRVQDFVAAEDCFRESLNITVSPKYYYRLGYSLAGQGRTTEAIEAYRAGIYERPDNAMPYTSPSADEAAQEEQGKLRLRACSGWEDAEDWMQYAVLLSQTGQKAEATKIYQKALPFVPDLSDENRSLLGNINALSPAAFQALAYVATGLCTGMSIGHIEAMRDFTKARILQPDSALTNYFYGNGWQKLAPAERAKFGDAAQAKAALEKAVKSGTPGLKKAAQKALLMAAKP